MRVVGEKSSLYKKKHRPLGSEAYEQYPFLHRKPEMLDQWGGGGWLIRKLDLSDDDLKK